MKECPSCGSKIYDPSTHMRRIFPRPPRGKAYIFVPVADELAGKIGALDANGHWESELSALLERTIEQFYRTRPVHLIRTPAH